MYLISHVNVGTLTTGLMIPSETFQAASRSIASVIVMITWISNFVRNNLGRNNHRNKLHNNTMVFYSSWVRKVIVVVCCSCQRYCVCLVFFFRRKHNCRFYVLSLSEEYLNNLSYFVNTYIYMYHVLNALLFSIFTFQKLTNVNLILVSTMEHVLILYMTIIVRVNTATLDVIVRMVRIYRRL